MAIVTVNAVKIPLSSGVVIPDFVAQTASTDGVRVDFSHMDTRTVIIVQNSGATAVNVTIEKGDGIQGVADEVFSVPNGKMIAFNLESGKFKQTTGANKGYVVMKAATNDIKFAAVVTN